MRLKYERNDCLIAPANSMASRITLPFRQSVSQGFSAACMAIGRRPAFRRPFWAFHVHVTSVISCTLGSCLHRLCVAAELLISCSIGKDFVHSPLNPERSGAHTARRKSCRCEEV